MTRPSLIKTIGKHLSALNVNPEVPRLKPSAIDLLRCMWHNRANQETSSAIIETSTPEEACQRTWVGVSQARQSGGKSLWSRELKV